MALTKDNHDHKTGRDASVTPTAIVPGTWPSPIDGFRAAVHGVAVTVVNGTAGDEDLPYPTGTPLAAGSKFWLSNGYYKSATPT